MSRPAGAKDEPQIHFRSIYLDGNQLLHNQDGVELPIRVKRDGDGWYVGCTWISSDAMEEIIKFVRR
jgi:hypothetical protein